MEQKSRWVMIALAAQTLGEWHQDVVGDRRVDLSEEEINVGMERERGGQELGETGREGGSR